MSTSMRSGVKSKIKRVLNARKRSAQIKNTLNHEIRLNDGKPPIVVCTCGWASEPSKELMETGRAAFAHAQETGHLLRGWSV